MCLPIVPFFVFSTKNKFIFSYILAQLKANKQAKQIMEERRTDGHGEY